MSKRAMTNFAQVLRLVETLTEAERATLRDVLRPVVVRKAGKSKGRAQPAGRPSSTRTGATTGTASSPTEPEGASVAALGASGD